MLVIEHLISIHYINYEDIELAVKYYTTSIASNLLIYNDFITNYGYQKAKKLFLRQRMPLPCLRQTIDSAKGG